MSIAKEIIRGLEPNYDRVIAEGYSLNDVDEYGFTPLIESVISKRPQVAVELLKRGVEVDGKDLVGRTALHWAVEFGQLEFSQLLLQKGANPNTYDQNGLSPLVYPVLRGQHDLKHLLYQFGAKLDFSLDFINGKLLGHRFELTGSTDILTPNKEFIELDYEGFILEFTVAVVKDALRRFTSSYSTRHLRHHFPSVNAIVDGFIIADRLLQFQHIRNLSKDDISTIQALIRAPLLILPAASRGHALCFVKSGEWWAKIDRGENSLKEGSVNIYQMTQPQAFNFEFIQSFLYRRQPRKFFHQTINTLLGLKPKYKLPLTSQIVGNCSWANVQGIIPTAYVMQQLIKRGSFYPDEAMVFFYEWVSWDQDRALDECVQRFYLADSLRKASLAEMLGAVLFQSCDAKNSLHLRRAEKIFSILTLPEYYFILQSYLNHYCLKRLTSRGNNLLKLMDDCGIQSDIEINPVATGLKKRE